MSEEPRIPLLCELIQRGTDTPEQPAPVTSAHNNFNLDISVADDDIEQEYHNALQEIQLCQQQIDIDLPVDEDTVSSSDEIDPAPNIRELLIDEEIRLILERHMDRAYQEIIKLISHKIS